MCETLALFNLVCDNECAPTTWREGLIASRFKKGDRKTPVIIEA